MFSLVLTDDEVPEMYRPRFQEDLMQFVRETGVHRSWLPIFQDDLLPLLYSSISDVEHNCLDYDLPMIPERSKILLALSRCPPQDVKVVILGHGPISDKNLATGFAFSFPNDALIDRGVGQRDFGVEKGRSVKVLHDVLVDAGYLERGADYDSCHEVWADRGVLLLNASLTYSKEHEHFPMWEKFVCRLLFLVALYSTQERLFFLCWGSNATVIGEQLHAALERCNYSVLKIKDDHHSREIDDSDRTVVFIGHHPTFPPNGNQFTWQATHQFRAIKRWYPDLFTLPRLT